MTIKEMKDFREDGGTKYVTVYAIAEEADDIEPNVDELEGLPEGCVAAPGSIIMKPSTKAASIADSVKFREQ